MRRHQILANLANLLERIASFAYECGYAVNRRALAAGDAAVAAEESFLLDKVEDLNEELDFAEERVRAIRHELYAVQAEQEIKGYWTGE